LALQRPNSASPRGDMSPGMLTPDTRIHPRRFVWGAATG
jgi:hypothetical protein